MSVHSGEKKSIPEPSGLPLLGNIKDVDSEFPLGSMVAMADKYGTIPTILGPEKKRIQVGGKQTWREGNERKWKWCLLTNRD